MFLFSFRFNGVSESLRIVSVYFINSCNLPDIKPNYKWKCICIIHGNLYCLFELIFKCCHSNYIYRHTVFLLDFADTCTGVLMLCVICSILMKGNKQLISSKIIRNDIWQGVHFIASNNDPLNKKKSENAQIKQLKRNTDKFKTVLEISQITILGPVITLSVCCKIFLKQSKVNTSLFLQLHIYFQCITDIHRKHFLCAFFNLEMCMFNKDIHLRQ